MLQYPRLFWNGCTLLHQGAQRPSGSSPCLEHNQSSESAFTVYFKKPQTGENEAFSFNGCCSLRRIICFWSKKFRALGYYLCTTSIDSFATPRDRLRGSSGASSGASSL